MNEFETIFKKNYKRLFVISHRITKDPDVTEDIIQDVFLKIWENKSLEEFQGSIESYIATSVYNRSLNHIRDSKKKVSIGQVYVNNEPEDKNAEVGSQFDLRVLKNEIRRAIDELPPQSKTVFILCRLEQMKYKEIAKYLDLSIKTVEKHMSLAIKRINENLTPRIRKEFMGTESVENSSKED